MKKICEWLCPQQKRNEGPYDVHEETFEMDQNLGSIELTDKIQGQDTMKQDIKSQSNESLSSSGNSYSENVVRKTSTTQEEQRKFVENKHKFQQQNQGEEQKITTEQKLVVEQIKQAPPKPKYNILGGGSKKKKVDLTNYFFKQETDQFKVKSVDSLKGEQFNIDGCKNGTYFVFDVTANLYIDDCQNCFVFIAPCDASIFIRNCKDMIVVGVSGQFRTYNCHNCHFSIYCKSQPVIESSSQIHFSSLNCPEYPQLRSQFQKWKLSPFNNNWSQIHNFTKKQGETHHYLDRYPSHNKQIDWERAYKQANLQMVNKQQQIVPFIQGLLPLEEQANPVLLILSEEQSEKDQQVFDWLRNNNITLLKSSKLKFENQQNSTIALLINQPNEYEPNYEEIGNPTVIKQKAQVQQKQQKYFITFKDER